MVSNAGLAVFVLYVAAAAGVLVFDASLYLSGRTTITEWAVRDPARWKALVALTAAGAAAGVAGLAAHFAWY